MRRAVLADLLFGRRTLVIVVWSVKGGVGVSVIAAAAALWWARTGEVGLVDAAGDQASVFGLPGASRSSVVSPSLEPVRRLVAPRLTLWESGSREALVDVVVGASQEVDTVVVDAGSGAATSPWWGELEGLVDRSVLVLRPCYLALARAVRSERRPTEVVLVEEPGRSLGVTEVAAVLGLEVRWRIPWHPSVARVVDAGVVPSRLLGALARSAAQS